MSHLRKPNTSFFLSRNEVTVVVLDERRTYNTIAFMTKEKNDLEMGGIHRVGILKRVGAKGGLG